MRPLTIRVIACAMLALALGAPVRASERQPTLAELERELVCPTCQSVLELSHAPIAERMRSFIRTRIAAGDTKGEIKAKLVEQLGPGVLAAPPRRGFDLLAWIAPFVVLIASGLAVGAFAWRLTRVSAEQADAASGMRDEADDPAFKHRLDKELARLRRLDESMEDALVPSPAARNRASQARSGATSIGRRRRSA
jgi:cytochrome c-type biogenesis protein CcmH